MKKALIDRKLRKRLEDDKDVLAVILFGSAARGKEFSDIDLCIVLNKQKSNLSMSEKRLKYLSIAGDRFDIQIFQQLPIYLRSKILGEGKVIFCRNEKRLYELAFSNMKEFEDFKKLYRAYLEAVALAK